MCVQTTVEINDGFNVVNAVQKNSKLFKITSSLKDYTDSIIAKTFIDPGYAKIQFIFAWAIFHFKMMSGSLQYMK